LGWLWGKARENAPKGKEENIFGFYVFLPYTIPKLSKKL
jgi:hypothetical protein